ncbi:carbon storage regulator CsrA [Candidatus Poribacteria bacterium]|nr:carbon storage regulator CsrA [Candidatus Poribacteria bacterium]
MLILARKIEQEIVIKDNIIIQVVEIKKDHVKLGITAPDDISVHRREIYDSIKEINEASANLNPDDINKIRDKISKNRR